MTQGYVGPDRRGTLAPRATGLGTSFTAAAIATVFVLALLVRLAAGTATDGALASTVTDLDVATIVAATMLGGLGLQLWRATGETRLRWCALGAWGLGLAAAAELVRGGAGTHGVGGAVASGATYVAVIALALACWAPEVDSRARFRSSLGLWAGATFILTIAATAVDAVAAPPVVLPASHLAAGAATGAVGVVALRTAKQRDRRLTAWIALLLATVAFSQVATGLWHVHAETWRFSSSAARLLGCLVATVGFLTVLRQVHADQRVALHTSETERRVTAASLQAEREERAHEARNALTAIEAATLTLERHRDRLSVEQRATLLDGVSQEVARLQRLVAEAPRGTSDDLVDLGAVVDRQVALARSRGDAVEVEPAACVTEAIGDATEVAEIVQNLLVNAARHGGSTDGAVVSIAPDPQSRRVLIRVEDRGVGIPVTIRERIFERTWRGEATCEGSGLGLTVSRRLARARGGDLWVEGRPGGGASFVLALPAAPGASLTVPEVQTLGGWPVEAPEPPGQRS